MTNVRLIRAAHLSHAEYADASVVRADKDLIFLAGACPLNADGAVVAPGDIAAQTSKALENMDEVLLLCGVNHADVAFLRILVVAQTSAELGTAWTVVRQHFGDHAPPATLQGVSVLGYPGQLVEIEPVAARETRRG